MFKGCIYEDLFFLSSIGQFTLSCNKYFWCILSLKCIVVWSRLNFLIQWIECLPCQVCGWTWDIPIHLNIHHHQASNVSINHKSMLKLNSETGSSRIGYLDLRHMTDNMILNTYWSWNDCWICARSCKRIESLLKSLLFWLVGDVSWLDVEVLSPCWK